jgi:hypothetical protein
LAGRHELLALALGATIRTCTTDPSTWLNQISRGLDFYRKPAGFPPAVEKSQRLEFTHNALVLPKWLYPIFGPAINSKPGSPMPVIDSR